MKPRHEQALVLVSVLATLLLLEVIAKGYLLHFASYQNFIKFAPPSMLEKKCSISWRAPSIQIYPLRYIGYIPAPNYEQNKNKHNEWGFRGADATYTDNDFVIALLGGSTTYTSRVNDYQKSYPYLLEKKLNMALKGSPPCQSY